MSRETVWVQDLFSQGQDEVIIKSPMNYIGGKAKLLPQLLPLFPSDVRCFVDLFCGGCTVGINANARSVVFNDNLSYLIDLYKAFASCEVEQILAHIHRRIRQFSLSQTNDEGYRSLRRLYNEERCSLDLFVLVAYSFNHQIRFNSAHEFNNPFGRERSHYNSKMQDNLLHFLERLKVRDVSFTSYNFDKFDFKDLTSEDFVYCDPPYLITTGTYNDGKRGFTGWGIDEELRLLGLLEELDQRGLRFALSNVVHHKGRTNELLQEWVASKGFELIRLEHHYANASYHTINRDKNSTVEVLIRNY